MKRLALLLLLAGCDSSETPMAPSPTKPVSKAPPTPTPSDSAIDASEAAAAALRLYYRHVGRRDFRAAWALRERRPGLSLERFAASFDGYEDYRATVGIPSLPAEQDGTLWVEVPVQLYGRMRGGAPFGSVGRVTMKRPAGEESWQVAP